MKKIDVFFITLLSFFAILLSGCVYKDLESLCKKISYFRLYDIPNCELCYKKAEDLLKTHNFSSSFHYNHQKLKYDLSKLWEKTNEFWKFSKKKEKTCNISLKDVEKITEDVKEIHYLSFYIYYDIINSLYYLKNYLEEKGVIDVKDENIFEDYQMILDSLNAINSFSEKNKIYTTDCFTYRFNLFFEELLGAFPEEYIKIRYIPSQFGKKVPFFGKIFDDVIENIFLNLNSEKIRSILKKYPIEKMSKELSYAFGEKNSIISSYSEFLEKIENDYKKAISKRKKIYVEIKKRINERNKKYVLSKLGMIAKETKPLKELKMLKELKEEIDNNEIPKTFVFYKIKLLPLEKAKCGINRVRICINIYSSSLGEKELEIKFPFEIESFKTLNFDKNQNTVFLKINLKKNNVRICDWAYINPFKIEKSVFENECKEVFYNISLKERLSFSFKEFECNFDENLPLVFKSKHLWIYSNCKNTITKRAGANEEDVEEEVYFDEKSEDLNNITKLLDEKYGVKQNEEKKELTENSYEKKEIPEFMKKRLEEFILNPPPGFERLVDEAKEALEKKDIKKAKEVYEKIEKLTKNENEEEKGKEISLILFALLILMGGAYFYIKREKSSLSNYPKIYE